MSGEDGKSLTAPKFSSFKSKQPPPKPLPDPDASSKRPAPDASDGRASREKKRRTETRRDHKHHTSERHHRSHRSKDSEAPVTQALVKLGPATRVEPTSRPGDVEGLFIIDKRGDPLISRYQSNDRYKVPSYRRSGRGRVLGSNGYLTIHREGARDEFSIRMPGEGISGKRQSSLLRSNARSIKPRRIKALPPDDASQSIPDEQDFVPLKPLASHDSEGRAAPDTENEDDGGPNYRSIEGKAKAHAYSDSELEYDSADETGAGNDFDEPTRQRSVELARRVKEQPGDIEAWLELIAHQDVLLRTSGAANAEPTEAEVRSYAEIKLSMYDSALKHVKCEELEERLLLGSVLEAAKVWPSTKVERRWEEVVKKRPASFALWGARLDFSLTAISTFQYQEMRDRILDRLHSIPNLSVYPNGPMAGSPSTGRPAAPYEQMIYVFLRASRFVYEAGYRELAVAAWQALLELNTCRPASADEMNPAKALELFQEFWENEAPRMGEDNALGWAHYAEKGDDVEQPEPRNYSTSISKSRDVYKSWGNTEELRASESRQPARAMDDGNEDDPYRVIMFSDIQKFLFLVPRDVLPDVQQQLLDSFLLFCQLPPATTANEWTSAATIDPFIVDRMKVLEAEASQKPMRMSPDEEDQSSKSPSFNQDVRHLVASQDVLFASSNWYQYFSGWPSLDKENDGPVRLSLAVQALRHLVHQRAGFEDMARYSLALERVNDPGAAKKRAKALLKRYPAQISLYAAYGLAEKANCNVNVARQVVTSAATLIKSKSSEKAAGTLEFWTTWAVIELEAGDKNKAVACLCAAAGAHPPPSGPLGVAPVTSHQLLNARQTLSGDLGYQLSNSQISRAVSTAEALILLEYLTTPNGSESASNSQGNIASAMARVWKVSKELSNRGYGSAEAHERVLQAGARLVYFHATQGPFRSAYLREQLGKCIQRFPRNSMFLSLFAWASPNFGIEDPAREILRDMALLDENDCISSRVFAIRYELQRGNAHSARAAFERALGSPACRSNSALWRCYVRFCYARKEFRAKAKEVFFRGIGHCPSSKELAMEAFTTLVNVMDEYELRSVFDTMASKGLRIHVDLEEFGVEHKR